MKSGLRQVMLGHLSKENNFPELAYKTVVDELIECKLDFSKIKVDVATRNTPSKIVELYEIFFRINFDLKNRSFYDTYKYNLCW